MSEAAAALSSPATVEPAQSDNGATGDTGTAPSTWTEGFSEDTMAYVSNKGWKDPGQLLESYRNLEKFSGGSKNLVEIPGVDASDEAMASFYDRLGRPGDASGYGFNVPEGGDEQLSEWFGEAAHRFGLSNKQANSLFNEWNEYSATRMENMQHEMKVRNEADIDGLKKEWGAEYDNNLNSGRRAVAALGYDEQALSALETKMGTAEMLKLFSAVGARMGEDSFVDGNNSGGFGATPGQAQAQIADLKADQQFMAAYMSGDRAAVDKMQTLMGKAYG